MSAQDMFGIVAILYCVANLGSMGLELNLPETLKALKSPKLITLTLVWSWIISPALAILITKILPLSDAHGAVRLRLVCVRAMEAPCLLLSPLSRYKTQMCW